MLKLKIKAGDLAKKLSKKQQNEYDSLTKKEKKIYDATIRSFPATSHLSALDNAIQGGVRLQARPLH
jgi:DNA-binding MurR/RpiR family transcriptional regulator